MKELQEGKATWLLNGSKAEGSLAWYQKLGENGDAYPVLKSTGDNTVYLLPLHPGIKLGYLVNGC
uniref:hypothetical protein n=1 Tax=Prevotella sp. TaxID=59823 RepID=UPI0040280755